MGFPLPFPKERGPIGDPNLLNRFGPWTRSLNFSEVQNSSSILEYVLKLSRAWELEEGIIVFRSVGVGVRFLTWKLHLLRIYIDPLATILNIRNLKISKFAHLANLSQSTPKIITSSIFHKYITNDLPKKKKLLLLSLIVGRSSQTSRIRNLSLSLSSPTYKHSTARPRLRWSCKEDKLPTFDLRVAHFTSSHQPKPLHQDQVTGQTRKEIRDGPKEFYLIVFMLISFLK